MTVFFQCGQANKNKEGQQTAADTATGAPDSSALRTVNTILTEIDSNQARTYVDNFRKWTKIKGNPVSLCTTSKDTLKWLRIEKGKVASHIGTDEGQLPDIKKHAGIRIYPGIDENGKQNYILVYTNIIPKTIDWHEDDLKQTLLYNIEISDTTWCKLSEKSLSKNKELYIAHHMCEPDCDNDKARY